MRRVFFIVFILLSFLLSNSNISMAYEKEIKSISASMAENIANAGKKMIAVVDFTDLQGNVTALGRFLAEEFSVALAGAGKGFEVVDRTHLKSIVAEHKLSASGIIDPQTARKLGQIAGVDALITGTITPFGDSVRISVKILDTATAKVIGASSGDIAKTKAIEELLARGIENQLIGQEASASGYVSPSINKGKVFKNDFVIITLGKLKKSKNGEIISLDAAYENISKKRIKFTILRKNTYLIDENANRWLLKGSSGIEDNAWHATTIEPSRKIQTLLEFVPEGDNRGKIFTLSVGHYRPESFSAIFESIRITP